MREATIRRWRYGPSRSIPARPTTAQDYFDAKARLADEQAATASNSRLAERWRHIAETYRGIAYRRRAFGTWPPPVPSVVSDDRKGHRLLN